ncbi:MAG: 2'-deoxycytidine 5'-triphosphate deaminase, partial [Terriglobia bacterium]
MSTNPDTLFPLGTGSRGILPSQSIHRLIEAGHIRSTDRIEDGQIQPASIDLRLGHKAYRVSASFLPGANFKVETRIQQLQTSTVDITKPAIFERSCVYIVPLVEELALPGNVAAKANPKSTTGRLDIFTRLITDYGTEFERVPQGYEGKLYAEIVPRTFPIGVKAGMKLSQLRFIRGKERDSDTMLADLDKKYEGLVYKDDEATASRANIRQGLWITVDLQGDGANDVIAFKAKKNAPVIYLDRIGFYDPEDFWEPIRSRLDKGLVLDQGDFYLLASKEKIRVPPS